MVLYETKRCPQTLFYKLTQITKYKKANKKKFNKLISKAFLEGQRFIYETLEAHEGGSSRIKQTNKK